jgi:hypothetical protein
MTAEGLLVGMIANLSAKVHNVVQGQIGCAQLRAEVAG